ncbi:hypothetical protein ABEF93_005647 [Exophiala dermatitidis]
MDSSTNGPMNGSQPANNPSYTFLESVHNFAASDALQDGGEDYSQYFDPALFDNTTIGPGFSQQQQTMSQNFNPNVARQSNSPALPQYNPSQQNYSMGQYQQGLYDSRQMPQHNYDPGFYARPSASPVGFDSSYGYHAQMPFNGQNYDTQQAHVPARQTPTPTANYQPRQQQPSPYVNIGPRPSQLSQSPGMMQYPSYQEQQSQHTSNPFVDPSLLTASQLNNPNQPGSSFQPHQQFIAPSYFKPGSTIDPQSLQGQQPFQPVQQPQQQSLQIPQSAPVIQPKPEKSSTSKPAAARKANSATKKNGSAGPKAAGQTSGADSDPDSDDDLVIEDQEPPETTPALLCVSKPTDERGRALYDAVQAVWYPRNKPVPAEKIRSAIAAFGETVRGLRDAWKAKNDSLRKAEIPNSPTASQAGQLKEDVARYRQVMESVMARSLLYGHPAIVKRLGDNPITMAALYSFMLDRFNAGDYDSTVVAAILKFVVEFKSLDTEMLEMTKLSKILQRLTKKATSDIKTMSQTILDNAVTASAEKAAKGADGKSEKPASPAATGNATDAARKEAVAGVKRAREADSASSAVPKKVVKVIPQSSKPLALQNAERRKALDAAQASKGSDKSATGTSATAAAKAKIAVTAPPKSAVFSSLMSASKKPGTSIAARAAAAAAAKDKPSADGSPAANSAASAKKEQPRKESPPRNGGPIAAAKTTSSFLGLLADMEKKPDKEVKKEAERPNETEEERAQRLRKEARRKLRVSWKADAELVDIRLFTHDPEEEIGQADSLKRDAGDTGKEGEALKMHKDMEDLEEDEDEDAFEEFEPYTTPSEVDFSVLKDEADLLTMNGIKHGGAMKAESPSSEAQDKHEQDTVMTIYASKADRPPTPKEPDDTAEDFEPAEPETPFGEPSEKTRQRETEYRARLARNQPNTNPMPSTRLDLAAQIQAMTMAQTSQPQSTLIPAELQRTLSMLGRSSQATPPPQPTTTPALDIQALLQTVQQVSQNLQGPMQQPTYQNPVQPPIQTTNLSDLLASLQQSAAPQPTTAALGLAGSAYSGSADDASRKHGRTDSNDYDNDDGRKGGNKKKKGAFTGGDQSRPYNYKTQPCAFWEQGKCIKGDMCTYRHGDEDA